MTTLRPFQLFYQNPRLLALAIALIVVAGLSSYYVLPRMEDPVMRQRAAIVTTRFPGASAQRVEALVTDPLEDELQEIEEIKRLRSTSRAGVSVLTIELHDKVIAVDEVWSRIRDKLDDGKRRFPIGVGDSDFEELHFKAYALIVAVTWTQDDRPNYQVLRRRALDLEDQLRTVPGVEAIDRFGDPGEEIVVEPRPHEMTSLGLSADAISAALASSDAKVSAGLLRGKRGDFVLEIDNQLDSLERIGAVPLQTGGQGQFVRLADIAGIRRTVADPPRSLAIINGRPAIALGVLVESDRRIDHWTAEIKQVLADYDSRLPRGVELHTMFEQNRFVQSRLAGLMFNLMIGASAIALVVLFLLGVRSALVVGIALPLSALMVLAGMRWLEIPIHQMSVTGLIIALGLLIDNAIVIVDEVQQRLQRGQPPHEAVSQSVRHLAIPLFGSTLTTALAFAPLALLPGNAGEFVSSIGVSVIMAIVSSFLLAMTITPALAALGRGKAFGQNTSEESPKPKRRPVWREAGFSHPQLTRWYRAVLDRLFRRPGWGIALGLVLPILGFAVGLTLPEQFFPPADRDQFQVELELPAQASLEETIETARAIRERLLAHNETTAVDWFLGESAPPFYYNMLPSRRGNSNYAQAFVQLNSAQGARGLIHRLQHELDHAFPQARVLVRQLEQGPPFDAPIEVRLVGPDLDLLRAKGRQIRVMMSQLPEVVHTRADLGESNAKLALKIDEEQARLAGLDHAAIARQLDAALEGKVGGAVLQDTEELPVRVRIGRSGRNQLNQIEGMELVSNHAGRLTGPPMSPSTATPLTAIGKTTLTPEESGIPRYNGQRVNEVRANLQAGVLPAPTLARLQTKMAENGFQLPPGYRLEYGGEAAERDDAVGNLIANTPVLMVLMGATLVLAFGSFRIASVITTVAVLSVGMGLGVLWIFGYPFGFMAIIGIMGLVGVAINDTIVVLAALREDPQARAGNPRAVREVVLRATRHVIATTLTTIAGFTPLILGGGGFWPPLATAIAGGVAGATMLALTFAPSAYILLMCRNSKKCAVEVA